MSNNEKYVTTIRNNELVLKVLEQSGTILPRVAGDNLKYVTCIVETADSKELALKVFNVGGGGGGYTLPTATADRLGGIKVGQNLTAEEDGTLNATGGGSSDYADLSNKPSINSVTLSGNKTSNDLGVANVDLSNLTSEAKPNIIDTLSDIYNTVSYTVVGAPTISNGIASGFNADDYVQIPTSLTFSGASDIEFDIEFTTPSSLTSATYPIIGCDSIWTSPLLYIESGSSLLFDGVGYAGYSNIQTDTTYRANIKIKDNSGTIVLYGSDGTVIGQHTQSTSFAEKTVTLLLGAPYGNNSNVVKNININKTSIKVNGEYLFIGNSNEVKPAHLAMPSDTFEDLTVTQATLYTAPADGYILAAYSQGFTLATYKSDASDDSWNNLILNSTISSGTNVRGFCPVRKGQKFMFDGTGTLQHARFIYARGTESEYTPS